MLNTKLGGVGGRLKSIMDYQVPFADALNKGNESEKKVLERIKKVNPKAHLAEGKVAEYDIVVPETGQTIEVKYDTKCLATGNVFVETMRRNYDIPQAVTPTGINATTADVWVFNLGDGFYWIRTEQLKELVDLFKTKRGGDNNRTLGVLIPKEQFLLKAHYWFK